MTTAPRTGTLAEAQAGVGAQVEKEAVHRAVQEAVASLSPALRTIACGLVVAVHANMVLRPSMTVWWPAGILLAPIYCLPVPTFFLLSGYFAGAVGRGRALSPAGFLRRKAAGLVLPALFWGATLAALQHGWDLPWPTLAAWLTGTWQLYYLFVLLQLLYLRQWLPPARLKAVLAVTALAAIAFHAAADWTLWTRGATSEVFEIWLNRTPFPWALFFFLGMALRQRPAWLEWLRNHWGRLLLLTLAAYTVYDLELTRENEVVGFNPLQQMLFSALFFKTAGVLALVGALIAAAARPTCRAALTLLGRAGADTFGIYLCHTSWLLVLVLAMDRAGLTLPFAWEVPLVALAAWTVAQALTRLARRQPFTWLTRALAGYR